MHDDDEPQRPDRRVTPLALDGLGIGELQDYIAELNAEIARANEAIDRKQAQRTAAESVFRNSKGESGQPALPRLDGPPYAA